MMDSTDWMLVYSKPRHELKLTQRLKDLDIETYCPTVKTIRQWSDRKKRISEPLFKSYVFVRPKPHQIEKLFYVPGFSRFVYWLGKPVRIRNKEIEATKSFLNKVVHDSIIIDKFQIGQEVSVASGPLKQTKGKILEIGNNKAILHIDTLGTIVKAELSLTELIA